ncbi:MAG: hypothetical protein HEP71_05120 [Roseivirga sp.]|nr:hypothetical protein [Roseivirga sp.]
MTDSITQNWQLLGEHHPKSLAPTIAQIHHGVQFVAMLGKHFVENQPDDSHTNMEWLPAEEVLAGNWVQGPKGNYRLAMRPKDLELIIYNADMHKVDECSLDGKTNVEACRWLESHLDQFGEDSSKMNLMLHYEIPDHATDEGASYELSNQPLFAEMAKYRANGDLLLRHFASQHKTASEVRTWPHHFDNGAYIPVAFGPEGEHLKSFSIGMGIPDEASDEPYFYITTWSKAGDNSYENVPPLPAGEWISSPFSGAVLKASAIVQQETAEGQASQVHQFLKEGIAASINILNN